MELLYSKILGTPVISDGPRPLTSVEDLLLDPDNGTVVAFIVNAGKNLMISPVDVLEWNASAVHVGHSFVIIEAEEVVRVSRIQEDGRRFYRNKVYTKNGLYLGLVYDFSVDSKSEGLKKLYVAKDFLGLLRWDKRIIGWQNVLEVRADRVIVRGGMAKAEEEKVVVGTEATA